MQPQSERQGKCFSSFLELSTGWPALFGENWLASLKSFLIFRLLAEWSPVGSGRTPCLY